MRNGIALPIVLTVLSLLVHAASVIGVLYDFRVSATLHHFVHNRPMHLWTRELAEGATHRGTVPNRVPIRRSPAATNHKHSYLLSPTPDFIVPLEETTVHALTFSHVHHHSPSPNLDLEEDPLRLHEERIQLEEERREEIDPPVVIWRLQNRCAGYVQSFMHMVNARGRAQDKCLIDFLVHPHSRDGSVFLEQRFSRRYICLNRKGRVTARKLKKSRTASDIRCRFFEHLTPNGYTLLESVWRPGRYLVADRRGRLTEGRMARGHIRCFHFGKIATELGDDEDNESQDGSPRASSETYRQEQESLYDVARSLLLSRVEV